MSDPDPLMPIGVFSTATLVSIKALRLYHEQGLLVPAWIDPATGYRSYRVSQLADAQVIKRLRDLDVPLAGVAEVVRARDPEVTRRVIAAHQQVMRERLDDLGRIVAELQEAVSEPLLQTPVFVRTEPSQHALAIAEMLPNPEHETYTAFLGRAYALLDEAFARLQVAPAGAAGALYPPKVDGGSEVVTAYFPVAAPVLLDDRSIAGGVVNLMLPTTTCAVLTHRGSFASIGHTYRQLGAWVATNATVIDQPVREIYVTSIDDSGALLPDSELRTEIAWPIEAP
ncbi:MAG: MerR family transcriptional regulator [Actinobacteria bacterium]|nr:MerR family transcriptional regulator [Actinomycetota bacterium]